MKNLCRITLAILMCNGVTLQLALKIVDDNGAIAPSDY